jgi:NADH:ubiquinone oxidoreductase subunit D
VSCGALKKDLARWRTVNSESLAALNKLLEHHKIAALPTIMPSADPVCSEH